MHISWSFDNWYVKDYFLLKIDFCIKLLENVDESEGRGCWGIGGEGEGEGEGC